MSSTPSITGQTYEKTEQRIMSNLRALAGESGSAGIYIPTESGGRLWRGWGDCSRDVSISTYRESGRELITLAGRRDVRSITLEVSRKKVALLVVEGGETDRKAVDAIESDLQHLYIAQRLAAMEFLVSLMGNRKEKGGAIALNEKLARISHFMSLKWCRLSSQDGRVLAEWSGERGTQNGMTSVAKMHVMLEDGSRFEFERCVEETLYDPVELLPDMLADYCSGENVLEDFILRLVSATEGADGNKWEKFDAVKTAIELFERLKGTGSTGTYCVAREEDVVLGRCTADAVTLRLMQRAIETKEAQADRDTGFVAFTVGRDLSERIAVAAQLDMDGKWNEHNVGGMADILRLFVTMHLGIVRSAHDEDEMGILEVAVKHYMNATRNISSAGSFIELIMSAAEGLSLMTFADTYVILEERENVTVLQPSGSDLNISAKYLHDLVYSGERLTPFLYSIRPESLRLMPDEKKGAEVYLFVLREKESTGFIIVSSPGYPQALFELRRQALSLFSLLIAERAEIMRIREMAAAAENRRDSYKHLMFALSKTETMNTALSLIARAATQLTDAEEAVCIITDTKLGTVIDSAFSGNEESANLVVLSQICQRMMARMEGEVMNQPGGADGTPASIAGVPFRLGANRKGCLLAMNRRGRVFTSMDMDTLHLLAHVAENALRGINARWEKSRTVHEMEMLRSAGIALYSGSTKKELVLRLARSVSDLFRCSAVLVITESGGARRVIYSSDEDVEVGSVVYNSSQLARILESAPFEARMVDRPAFEEEWAMKLTGKAMMAVRITTPRENLLVVAFTDEKTGFVMEDARRMSELSRIAAAALEKIELITESETRLKQLQLNHLMMEGLYSGKAEDAVLSEIMPLMGEIAFADAALLWKLNSDSSKVVMVAEHYRNGVSENLKGMEFDAYTGIVGSVLKNRSPALIRNAGIEQKGIHLPGTKVEEFESVLGLPIMSGQEIKGVLMLYRDTPPPFGNEELRRMMNICGDVSLILSGYRPDTKVQR